MKTEEDKAWKEIIKRMIEEDMENKAKAEAEDNYEKRDGKPYEIAEGEPPAVQAEIIRWIDDIVHKFGLVERQYARANFWEMAMPWEMPGVLETLTAHPKRWLPLHKIVNRLEDGSRFDFWRMVFENRHRIPQEELLQVWYNCFFDLGRRSFLQEKQGKEEEIVEKLLLSIDLIGEDKLDLLAARTFPNHVRIGLLKNLVEVYDASEHKCFIEKCIAALFREILCACWEI